MKTEEIMIDGKKETIITGFEPGFDDDSILDDDLEDTIEIPVKDIEEQNE